MAPHIRRIPADWEPMKDGVMCNPFSAEVVSQARASVLGALNWQGTWPSKSVIRADLVKAHVEHSGDPDTDLAIWLKDGCPMGIAKEITSRGIFPPAVDRDAGGNLPDMQRYEAGWTNYGSAEENMDTVEELLKIMSDNKWLREYEDIQSFRTATGITDVIINKVGLIAKQRADGSWKYRMIWDLLRSAVNFHSKVGERIVLPRVLDLINDIVDLLLLKRDNEEIIVMVLDFCNAFHLLPLHPEEQKYFTTCIGGKVQHYFSLVFGPKASPTVWGRFGAWLSRSTQALFSPDSIRMQLYVDDPAVVIRGDKSEQKRLTATILLWWLILEIPLAWNKGSWGPEVTWIGATFNIGCDSVKVSVSDDKVTAAADLGKKLLKGQVVTKKTLASFTGKCSHFAGIIHTLYPFVMPLWAVLYSKESPSLPSHMIHTARLKTPLCWILAFFQHRREALTRTYKAVRTTTRFINVSMDASPWGFGAILFNEDWRPIKYWYDDITSLDCATLKAETGVSDYMAVWEALALLITLRIWANDAEGFTFAARSDNSGVGVIAGKLRSPNPALNLIASEVALDLTKLLYEPFRIAHIRGIANIVPDALSRMSQPGASSELPMQLVNVERSVCPKRDKHFWLTLNAKQLGKSPALEKIFQETSIFD
jgi:hypothetical protein